MAMRMVKLAGDGNAYGGNPPLKGHKMIKAIALLTRRADLTREEFIDYYEGTHAPLMRRPLPQIRDYRRNFIDLANVIRAPGVPDPSFDVITELWFDDQAGYDDMLATYAQPQIFAQIEADMVQLFESDKNIQFLVDERCRSTSARSAKNLGY